MFHTIRNQNRKVIKPPGLVSKLDQRILVTGATGMIGGAIVRALLARNRSVRILARNPNRARGLFGSSVEILSGNLNDLASLKQACRGIEEIYHAAAIVGFRHEKDEEILDTNVEGTRRLLAAAREAGVSRLVYTSSVAVYGDELPLGVTEEAPLRPSGIYGVSKVRAEQILKDAARSGFHSVIVRPCIVYGPGDRYFLPQASWTTRLPFVPLPDHGRHIVEVAHADDVAAALLLVMEKGIRGEAYNVTDGGNYELRELLNWIAAALHRSPRFVPIPRWLAHSTAPVLHLTGQLGHIPNLASLNQQSVRAFFSDYRFDISKISSLGYIPRIHAQEGLRNAFREYA